jgi:TonB-dependent SusC/RagA subfamily outer membrane receptor
MTDFMKLKFIILLVFAFSAVVFTAFQVDDDPLNALLKKLEVYNEKNPQEKVHLHLDKPYYAIGDDIWFKAYVIDTREAHPSNLSNILYVELINEKDSVKRQIKLPLMGGISWGDFKLTDSLSEGNYRIRAYTQLMRNAGPDFFFDKTIRIGNAWANRVFTSATYQFSKNEKGEKVNTSITFTDKKGLPYAGSEVAYEVRLGPKNTSKGKATTNAEGAVSFAFLNEQPNISSTGQIITTITLPNKQKIVKSIPIKATSNTIDVRFFPEGGNLVETIPSKIAFKAVNSFGRGEDISGVIVDNEGTEVTKFNSSYLGMGNVIISPQSNKLYIAKVTFKDGSVRSFDLPKPQKSGYVLAVNNTDSTKVSVKVMLSTDLIGTGDVKLVAQNNGNVYLTTKSKTEKQVIMANIPKKDLPSGIVQFTLFSGANQPVAERLAFINNPTSFISTKLEGDKLAYAKKEHVKMSFTATADNKPTQGSFSISVTNTASVEPDPDNESNIFTSLLLTSDLSGYVEKPNHYFLENTAATRLQLDNLMLTQGWRRFLWKDIINNTSPVAKFAPEKFMSISGIVTTTGGKPIPLGKVNLFSSSGGIFAIDTLTDAKGRFNFDNISFSDSTKFVVQARTSKNKKFVEIKLDVTPGQLVTKNKNSGDLEINVNESLSSYIKKSENYFDELTRRGMLQHTIMLDEVNIVQKKVIAPNSANINGAGHADYVMTSDMLGTCITLSQCLQGRVAGLIIRNGLPYLTRNGGSTPMQIVLDGVNVEGDFIDNINPNDVETIEVLKSISYTAIYGSRGGGGVLVITTKRGGGNYSSNSYAPGIVTYAPKGYYSVREFYSPKYLPDVIDNKPDLRTTVYWNPHVVTDVNGKGQFDFYNTSEAGTYRVVMEGVNVNGQLSRNIYTYQVN